MKLARSCDVPKRAGGFDVNKIAGFLIRRAKVISSVNPEPSG